MPSRSIAVDVARTLAAKYPSSNTRQLARIAYRENKSVFSDYEHARSCVRQVRGEAGKASRKNKETIVKTTKFSFLMPESDAKPVEPVKLNLSGKGTVAGDWHIPYHDQEACDIAINHSIKRGFTEWLIINGDFLDFYGLSKFERDPRKRRFDGELDMGRTVLEMLLKVYKKIVFKVGNHEARYESYLRIKAPELIGVPEFELRKLLNLDESGIQFVKSNQIMRLGDVNVIHGHELPHGIAAPVNPARGLFLRAKASTICGHHHQTSQHSESDIRRKTTSCWSVGCLSELLPEYAPVNKYNHGFANVEIEGRDYHVENLRIVNGKAM